MHGIKHVLLCECAVTKHVLLCECTVIILMSGCMAVVLTDNQTVHVCRDGSFLVDEFCIGITYILAAFFTPVCATGH